MQPPIDAPSITDDPRSPMEQLAAYLSNPQSVPLRRRFYGVLVHLNTTADVASWIRAARALYERAVIEEDGWVYFAAICLECLTHCLMVVDPELTRSQGEIDSFDRSYVASDDDDDVDDTREMRALFAAYDARARIVRRRVFVSSGSPIWPTM